MRQMYPMRRRARYNRDWAFPAPGSLPMGLRDVDNRPLLADSQVDLCPIAHASFSSVDIVGFARPRSIRLIVSWGTPDLRESSVWVRRATPRAHP